MGFAGLRINSLGYHVLKINTLKVFKHQHWHIVILLALLYGLYLIIQGNPLVLQGELFNIPGRIWFLLAVISPVLHQLYVLICWRLELYHKSLSKLLGDKAFNYFKIVFAILILSRIITVILLAVSTSHTLKINTGLSYVLAVILLLPASYLFYSVKKYFGMDRAFGLDHFEPEHFKNEPFVRKGIFKYTANGMYIYGFLILWIPGLLLQSGAAILIALFNHLYIWVHYYFTELPDIREIYRGQNK